MNITITASFSLSILFLTSCEKKTEPQAHRHVTEATYGTMSDGREVYLFTLTNESGMTAKVTEYGAILVGVEVPDRNGKTADITHGYDSLEGWLTNTSYFGSTVGRYGNRIAKGRFSLGGRTFNLATNNDPGGLPCALHGGIKGFDKVLWSGEMTSDGRGVELTYLSKNGEEGYPGELKAVVTYSLNDENELTWQARATVTGSATPVNIVHHSYWNLSNDRMSTINDHLLTLNADHFLPTDAGLIPTGEIRAVEGTPFDFTEASPIGERLKTENESLSLGGGYDHCWVLTKKDGLRHAATLHDPKTGRTMEIHTDQPGIQFYGGNFLDGTAIGKNGARYPYRSACCLETQLFPDSPNQPSFPSSILSPGEVYLHTMVHKFTW
ncbi:aldose epimerase family protein [Roseibacillus persicicus]|uniref:aldose epimerase family protein n=1 Tax=Roseibacillus persicicus TaxID=454148 RepID=UPI00280D46EE|nr:aldose epimerase family protein [Roseibacillus persicicus]MDQ8189765.1 galactose mutarotase [Roseibacillus persicicus]